MTSKNISISNFKRSLVLAIVIMLGAVLNFNTADARPTGEPSFASITRMYSRACKKLERKHRKLKNQKVKRNRRPGWK